MPTGYTADLKIDTPFSEFAMRCARAMGACVLMRDDSLAKPIPDEFKPSTFYRDELQKAQAEVERIKVLSEEQWLAEYEDYRKKETDRNESRRERDTEQADIYNRMIRLTESWTPPTPDHEGMKKFMLEQLRESLNFDVFGDEFIETHCQVKPYAAWKAERIARAMRNVTTYQQKWAKEQERTWERNEWLRALRESLA